MAQPIHIHRVSRALTQIHEQDPDNYILTKSNGTFLVSATNGELWKIYIHNIYSNWRDSLNMPAPNGPFKWKNINTHWSGCAHVPCLAFVLKVYLSLRLFFCCQRQLCVTRLLTVWQPPPYPLHPGRSQAAKPLKAKEKNGVKEKRIEKNRMREFYLPVGLQWCRLGK